MNRKNHRKWLKVVLMAVSLIVPFLVTGVHAPSARAVPSYSRQTGFPCRSCHTTPPELTPLGRTFKLNGYTITGMPMTKAEKTSREAGLSILQNLPLSVFFDTSYTQTNKVQPGTQNGTLEFPQDVSLFVAGAWAPHLGSFVQFTYDAQDDHFSWDNTDIRYANSITSLFGKSFVYGLDMNNNPTVEDLWNATPAWGYPFIANDFEPSPAAVPIIDGPLAQDVAGFGGYGMWNDHFYLATTMYRIQHLGFSQPNSGGGTPPPTTYNIHGLAPYWRGAYQTTWGNNFLEVGTYGMWMKSTPNAVVGPTNESGSTVEDHYTDVAWDFQYDRTLPKFHNDILSLRGTYIHENSALNASFLLGMAGQVPHHLNTVNLNTEYHFGDRFSGAFGWFNTTGTRDTTLYAPAPISGSSNGSPKSSGYIANVSWWPRQNVDLAFQYTGYFNFNGSSVNYDTFGRNAVNNNTLYLLARFLF